MEAILRESLQNDDQLLVHVVGDRTTETLLNAMYATGGKAIWPKRRVRIEHGDGVMPDLIPPVKELGVIVVENPTHLALRDLMLKREGPERTDQMFLFRSLLDAGILLALAPTEPNNPYLNIMFASTYPGKPREALSRAQAVIAYTLTSAYAEFAEDDKGSLKPGKLADLAVLSQDIFAVSTAGLAQDGIADDPRWGKRRLRCTCSWHAVVIGRQQYFEASTDDVSGQSMKVLEDECPFF